MKCFRFRPRGRWQTALGVLLISSVAWVAFLAVVPTDCARQKIAERLSRATGRKVTLGRLRVGPLCGVSLGDLTIGAPASDNDPWLRVGRASIDVSLFQMLFGRVEPTAVDVQGLRLRVLRRKDGCLELADLLRPNATVPLASSDPDQVVESSALEFRFRDATVLVIDEATGTHLEVTGVEGRGTCQGPLASITELRGTLNGGTIRLAARLDRSDTSPGFEGQVRLRDVRLGPGMALLAYLVPVLSGTSGDLDGILSLDLYLRGRGDTRASIRETLVGQGRLGLDPVSLDGSRLLEGLGDLFDLPRSGRVGDVWADLTIKDGRVGSENLTVNVGKVPVVLAGWTDFDGRINYRVRAEGLLEKLPGKAQDYLKQLRPELKLEEVAGVEIGGTVDALRVTSHGVPINRGDNRRRLLDLSRRVRDQLRR